MARVAGIQIEKDSKGRPTYARINLKIHGERFIPQLNEMGAIEKTPFETALETAITGDELMDKMTGFIHEMYKIPPTGK